MAIVLRHLRTLGIAAVYAGIALFPPRGLAQIAADGTVGTSVSQSGSAWSITGGTQSGGNLFHSFSRLSVPTSHSATFSGAASVANIVGRVTGGLPSSIDGTLRSTIPGASLWLINPSGMVFGPNAFLDVQGSFHASTADYLKLGSSGRFDARTPSATVLASAPPSAFGFVNASPAPLSVDGSLLFVPNGSRLSLSGGTLTLSNAWLRARGGRIDAVSAASAGELQVTAAGLVPAGAMALGALSSTGSLLDVNSTGTMPAGSVAIRGGAITLVDSEIRSQQFNAGSGGAIELESQGAVGIAGGLIESSSFGAGTKGGIAIRAGGPVTLAGDARLDTTAGSGSVAGISVSAPSLVLSSSSVQSTSYLTGVSGNIALSIGDLTLTGGSLVQATADGSANGGRIDIVAGGTVSASGSGISTTTYGRGNAGAISVRAARVLLDGAKLQSNTLDDGHAGDVSLEVGTLDLRGQANVRSDSLLGAGASGSLTVNASGNVTIEGTPDDFPGLSTSTTFGGRGGSITVNAPLVAMNNGSISAGTVDGADAGSVTLKVGRLEMRGRSTLSASTPSGAGNGGAVRVNAAESIQILAGDLDYYAITTSSGEASTGNAGAIHLSAPLVVLEGRSIGSRTDGRGRAGEVRIDGARVVVRSGGTVDVGTDGAGAGGTIRISATESVEVSGALYVNGILWERSSLESRAFGRGDSGSILVEAPLVTVSGLALVRATTGQFAATGRAGDVTIRAGRIVLSGGVEVSSSNTGSGAGGNVLLSAGEIVIEDAARVTASAVGRGVAGNLSISATDSLRLYGGSTVSTEARSSDGGNITIRAGELLLLRDSQITTSVGSGAGNGGNISIDPVFVVLDNGRIVANAFGGNGGNITIVSSYFIADPASVVQASSQLGLSGTVTIAAPNQDVGAALQVLPGAFFDASLMLRESCASRAGRATNSFTGAGRGGLAAAPDSVAPVWLSSGTASTTGGPAAGPLAAALVRKAFGCGG